MLEYAENVKSYIVLNARRDWGDKNQRWFRIRYYPNDFLFPCLASLLVSISSLVWQEASSRCFLENLCDSSLFPFPHFLILHCQCRNSQNESMQFSSCHHLSWWNLHSMRKRDTGGSWWWQGWRSYFRKDRWSWGSVERISDLGRDLRNEYMKSF